ncbi:transcription cofactor vestigial-like protein 4 isoform X3 [Protopterus annectens]|uniref:transcription cofactor vestigial-like protein 4 isoform X3 n=1 Tax=Protopterus annectens TaxID=7888 RepID=UPI001CF95D4F|nr:transcription cofactor vestigial-like protein 4 isoform X3 [Protopterus annectens]
MAVANLHYITRMNSGFKVYILEGQPSLRTEERFRSLSSNRLSPTFVYPMKRKHSPDRNSSSEAAECRMTKVKQAPTGMAIRSKTMDGQKFKMLEKEKRPCLAAPLRLQTSTLHSHIEHPPVAIPRSPVQTSPVNSPTLHSTESCHCSPRRGSTKSSPSACLPSTLPHSPQRSSPQHSPVPHLGVVTPQSMVWASTPCSPVERTQHSPLEGTTTPSKAGYAYSVTASLHEPSDEPLALIKNPRDPSKVNSTSLTSAQTSMLQQMRPSVITCVSSNRSCCDSTTSSVNCCAGRLSTSIRREEKAMTPAFDPVVEEHFRRSLKKNYQHSDLLHTISTTGSVDDHFAKALGAKWLKLKAARDASLAECAQQASSPTSTSCSPQSVHSPVSP